MKLFKYLFLGLIVFAFCGFQYLLWWNTVGIKNAPSVSAIEPKPISAEKLMSTVNDWRYSQGFQPYTRSDILCNLAEERITEIQIDFEHTGFFERTKNKSFGFRYQDLAENLSRDYPDSDITFKAWLESPSHRKNLDFDYSHSCIRCENNYCVQIFANF